MNEKSYKVKENLMSDFPKLEPIQCLVGIKEKGKMF